VRRHVANELHVDLSVGAHRLATEVRNRALAWVAYQRWEIEK
jgi:hypothetical protein